MAEIEVIYEASSGNRYNLKTDPLLIGVGNFHNYAWDKEVTALRYGERVESWKKNAQTYSTTFWMVGTESQNRTVLRNLHNDFERDILNKSLERLSGIRITSNAILLNRLHIRMRTSSGRSMKLTYIALVRSGYLNR